MTYLIPERVSDISTVEGTGAFIVSGVRPPYGKTFADVATVGDILPYYAQNMDVEEWEQGNGVWQGPATGLVRTAGVPATVDVAGVFESSAGVGVLANFSPGTKQIMVRPPPGSSGGVPLQKSGTFTPVVAFNNVTTGVTYTSRVARYVKIGLIVFIDINIRLSNNGSGVGSCTISGLPFTSNPTTSAILHCSFDALSGVTGSIFSFAVVDPNTTVVTPALMADGSGEVWSDAFIVAGSSINISGHYIAAA